MVQVRTGILTPAPIEGSGGLRTIFQYADGLRRSGHEVELVVVDPVDWTAERMTELGAEWYGVGGVTLRKIGEVELDGYDCVLATRWDTAQMLKDSGVRLKGYIVQDAEFLFNPMGDEFLMGESSYLLGLQSFALGRWLSNMLLQRFGNRPRSMNFSADLNIYRSAPWHGRRRAVCFIHQPEKTRRCPKLGLQALRVVKERMPDVEIFVYGSARAPDVDFEVSHLGIISPPQLAQLYNYCRAGLCLSTSNPSRIPFEMMAAGLPVIDLHRRNNIFDMPDSACLLAFQDAESIAEAVCTVLNQDERASAMSSAGPEFMRDRDFSRETGDFVSGFHAWITAQPYSPAVFDPFYRREGVISEAVKPFRSSLLCGEESLP